MIEGLFASGSYQSSLELMDLSSVRHKAIAGNIANVHTPGYQRMDIPEAFMDKLKAAISSGDSDKIRGLEIPKAERAKGFEAQSPDGNNVNLDKEMLFLSENAFLFEMSSQMASSSLRRLEVAITGRVS